MQDARLTAFSKRVLKEIQNSAADPADINLFMRIADYGSTYEEENHILDTVIKRLGAQDAAAYLLRMQASRPSILLEKRLPALPPSPRARDALIESTDLLIRSAEHSSGRLVILCDFAIRCGATDFVRRTMQILKEEHNRSGAGFPSLEALFPLAANTSGRAHLTTLAANEPTLEKGHHRAIILGQALEPVEIEQLAAGADTLTIVVFKDFYGRLDVESIRTLLPHVKIIVEHGRTRMDRYSLQYRGLHTKVTGIAKEIVEVSNPVLGRLFRDQIVRDLVPAMTMEIADRIFFAALQLNAIYQVVVDPQVDDTVVVLSNDWRLYRLSAALYEENKDHKIRFCCWTKNSIEREKHFRE